jgi:ABC-type multidrug transport system fused ATPase/permease subunit
MPNKPLITWKSFPLIEFPLKSLLVVGVFIITGIFIYTVTSSMFWVILALIFLFISLIPYFVPSYYSLYDDYLVAKVLVYKRKRQYSEFKCFYADKRGVMLSTFSRPRGLDRFRGQSLRFSKIQEERDLVLKFFEEKIGNRF